MADEIKAPRPTVIAQEGVQVGDENTAAPHEVEVEVVQESVAAQVSPPRSADRDTVDVHETSVKLDKVITDPSAPEAVQVPDAGYGSLELPIHGLSAPTPEQVFASGGKKAAPAKKEENPA